MASQAAAQRQWRQISILFINKYNWPLLVILKLSWRLQPHYFFFRKKSLIAWRRRNWRRRNMYLPLFFYRLHVPNMSPSIYSLFLSVSLSFTVFHLSFPKFDFPLCVSCEQAKCDSLGIECPGVKPHTLSTLTHHSWHDVDGVRTRCA